MIQSQNNNMMMQMNMMMMCMCTSYKSIGITSANMRTAK